MKSSLLPSVVARSHKRLGRGHGSGRGKTSGRGTKGQKARGTIPPYFEGGQLSVFERLPYLRGKMRNKSLQTKPAIITAGELSTMPLKSTVTLESLKKAGIVETNATGVKVLSGGTLSVALTVAVPCSEGARKIIEKAGGTVS
jgi:large subunit ribosomal protein L15